MPIISKNIKIFIGICVGIFILQQVLNGMLEPFFGFVPNLFVKGYLWQAVTYLFLHGNLMHIIFNMLVLAMFGAELESIWGTKFFFTYYFGCGVGSIILYLIATLFFIPGALHTPVVGASGALYGLLLAYALLFPNRQLLFMFIFPLKAKHFVILIGAIELYMTLTQSGGQVANLVHLSGIFVGYLILLNETRRRNRKRMGGSSGGGSNFFKKKNKRHLKIIINND